ncbi:MAG: hypothetical protein ACE5JP_16240 [Candidatus Bipolaricaulia bacterium]
MKNSRLFLILIVVLMFFCNASSFADVLNDFNPYDVPIPDNGIWVNSDLSLSGALSSAKITKGKVYYEIRHTNPGDLDVWLTEYYDGSWHDYYLYHQGDLDSTGSIVEARDNIHTWDGSL